MRAESPICGIAGKPPRHHTELASGRERANVRGRLKGRRAVDWQLGLVLLCVVVAAVYVVRAAWRTWHPAAGGCGGSCGCGPKETAPKVTLISEDQLTHRLRASGGR